MTGEVVLDRTVEPGEAGQRLDVLLAAWLDEPRARAQGRITAGDVLVGADPASKSQRLAAGEQVVVRARPVASPRDPPARVPIRYEDEHLLIVAKPAGLVVHRGAGVDGGTLVEALQAMGAPLAPDDDPERPGIVHRLDRGTSGVLVVAKTSEARSVLVRRFTAHEVERGYWALVDGVPDPPSATVDAPIKRSQRQRTRFAVDPGGRPARSHYDVVEAFGRAAAVRVRLETGRTHQVRVHMAAVGHPVSGDTTYGASRSLRALLGLERPALHAEHLALAHPVTGRRIAVTEPLPDDLRAALAVLRGDPGPGSGG